MVTTSKKTTGKPKVRPFDGSRYLNTESRVATALDEALLSGDPTFLAVTLGEIARARGMTQLARETGLTREALYRALSSEGNPEMATILKVVQALGFQLRATPTKEG
jgi:probable addiction module antidote protein